MKYLSKLLFSLRIGIIFTFLLATILHANEPLNIVVDVWPPYVMLDGDQLKGVDVEVTKAVFADLKIPITME